MKVFHILLADDGRGAAGGTVCALELIRYFVDSRVENVLMTTDRVRESAESLGIGEGPYLRFVTVDTDPAENAGLALFTSYLKRVRAFRGLLPEIRGGIDGSEDVLVCHCPFFPSTVAFKTLSSSFEKDSLFWFHMPSPDILKGFDGHFLDRLNLPPSPELIHFKLNDMASRLVARNSIVIVDNPEHAKLFPRNRTVCIPPGATVSRPDIEGVERVFDLCFMGRFHAQKGLLEIPEILGRLKERGEDVSLLMLGDGDSRIRRDLSSALEMRGFSDNVEWAGFVRGPDRFRYLSMARVFIFPSHYEGFGIAALEAMACGLPTVAYDLPVFDMFKSGMVKVPICDNVEFARAVHRLLEDPEHYKAVSEAALRQASLFTWEKTGSRFLEQVLRA